MDSSFFVPDKLKFIYKILQKSAKIFVFGIYKSNFM